MNWCIVRSLAYGQSVTSWQIAKLGHFPKYSELPSLRWLRKSAASGKVPGEFHKSKSNICVAKSNICVANETQIWYSLQQELMESQRK